MSTLRVESVQNLAGQEKYMPVMVPAVTATGTNVPFSGIPNWVTRITFLLDGVSTNGASVPIIQLGTAGGFVTTGYISSAHGAANAASATASFTTGFGLEDAASAASVRYGSFELSKTNTNVWLIDGSMTRGANSISHSMGGIPLGGLLTQIRITTVNGTDVFDAGSVAIIYE